MPIRTIHALDWSNAGKRKKDLANAAGQPTVFRSMLHEILLSLSGHPSPLLRAASSSGPDDTAPSSAADRVISPPERALLASLAHLSDLHVRLLSFTAQISASHPSTI